MLQQLDLSPEERSRYARQMMLRGIGTSGQQKLKAARVVVVGAGGLGSPVLQYLVGAGVGHITLVDPDIVSESNLHRQVIHATDAVGIPKVESARGFAARLNSFTVVEPIQAFGTAETLEDILDGASLLIDCTDNVESRRACVAAAAGRCPLVIGAAIAFDGFVTVVPADADGTSVLDALYPGDPEPGDSCEMLGVLGPIVGVIGAIMATEAIKLLTGFGDPLAGRALFFGAHGSSFMELGLLPNSA
jgi:molybdopterin/thiamine biosynthesis adenylyltransferase